VEDPHEFICDFRGPSLFRTEVSAGELDLQEIVESLRELEDSIDVTHEGVHFDDDDARWEVEHKPDSVFFAYICCDDDSKDQKFVQHYGDEPDDQVEYNRERLHWGTEFLLLVIQEEQRLVQTAQVLRENQVAE